MRHYHLPLLLLSAAAYVLPLLGHRLVPFLKLFDPVRAVLEKRRFFLLVVEGGDGYSLADSRNILSNELIVRYGLLL